MGEELAGLCVNPIMTSCSAFWKLKLLDHGVIGIYQSLFLYSHSFASDDGPNSLDDRNIWTTKMCAWPGCWLIVLSEVGSKAAFRRGEESPFYAKR